MIELAVARLHSTADDPRDDPVVQLEGGPGLRAASPTSPGTPRVTLLDDRDYYLWDQRGTGFSTPEPRLPGERTRPRGRCSRTTDDGQDRGRTGRGQRCAACRDRLQGDGVDLNGYNTPQNAADLADLRVALGIDEWNLRGVSYGSALAMETIRSHPEGLHSVLLDSIVVPDEPFGAVRPRRRGAALVRRAGQGVRRRHHVRRTYGDLDELMADGRRRARRRRPTRARSPIPRPARTGRWRSPGEDMYAGLFRAMYDEEIIPALPLA